jgi:lysophospholipase L1-like esterase/PAS domain-containing protein
MPLTPDDTASHSTPGSGRDEARPVDQPASASIASAVAVPLIALGLLGAAVWFGSTPAPAPMAGPTAAAIAADPLSSWNDGPTKRAILEYVAAVTTPGSKDFVPVAERVAVFDNDGTLVCEKPIAHGMFLIDRVKALVERRPELAYEEPFTTLLTGDLDFVRRLGKKFFADLSFAALGGVPEEKLEAEARDFIRTARHPAFDVPLGETTFAPMKELIAFLRSRDFSVWICSGSGVHFMRPAAGEWYGIPPERVIASRPTSEMREIEDLELAAGESPNKRLDLVVLPELQVLNDEERKPVSIGEQIGRRPIFAAGNVGTGGDVEMLRWSQSGDRRSLQLLVLHDDADREMAYGEPQDESLTAAERYGWQVVRMAQDWKTVFARPLEKKVAAAAVAATPAAASTAPATATTPAEAGPPPTRWGEELAAFARADREQPAAPGGVCLLGSSNIRMWNTLADDFPGVNVVNRGVNGCRLTELAEFAPVIAAPLEPRLVVVSAGTNDLADGRTPDDLAVDFGHLVANLRRELPEVNVAFLAISPTIKRWEQREQQAEANAAVRAAIESDRLGAGVAFIDANQAFLAADGTPAPECFLDDQQHPSTIGNARRAEIMRPLLEQLLSE